MDDRKSGVAQGWLWLEDDWAIDISGLQEGAVDEEGWTYGTDFNWVTWPPQPGAGTPRLVRPPSKTLLGPL
jgi:hypothetical protein